MIKRYITIFLVIAAIVTTVICTADISDDTLDRPFDVSISDSSVPVAELGFASATSATDTASTTAVLLTAMTDRRNVEIRVNEASKDLWVGLGVTATVSGADCVLVTSTQPFEKNITDDVAISIIASETFSYSEVYSSTAQKTIGGIVLDDIANSATGNVAVEGIWTCTKDTATDAYDQGAPFGISGGQIVKTSTAISAGTEVSNGYVSEASSSAVATVKIKLG